MGQASTDGNFAGGALGICYQELGVTPGPVTAVSAAPQARSATSSLDRLGSEFGSGADAELGEYVNKVGLDCRA